MKTYTSFPLFLFYQLYKILVILNIYKRHQITSQQDTNKNGNVQAIKM